MGVSHGLAAVHSDTAGTLVPASELVGADGKQCTPDASAKQPRYRFASISIGCLREDALLKKEGEHGTWYMFRIRSLLISGTTNGTADTQCVPMAMNTARTRARVNPQNMASKMMGG